jgi:hypothetical protein
VRLVDPNAKPQTKCLRLSWEEYMNERWNNISLAKRFFALLMAIFAVILAAVFRSPSESLISSAVLLLAWNLAFIPSPPIGASIKDVHTAGLRGWRTPTTAKLVSLLALILFVAGIGLQIRG